MYGLCYTVLVMTRLIYEWNKGGLGMQNVRGDCKKIHFEARFFIKKLKSLPPPCPFLHLGKRLEVGGGMLT